MKFFDWLLLLPLMVVVNAIDFIEWCSARRRAIPCPHCGSSWRTSCDDHVCNKDIWYCGKCVKAWTVEQRIVKL